MFPLVQSQSLTVTLKMYTGKKIQPLEVIYVDVHHDGKDPTLTLHVLQPSGPSLIGLDWLQHIRLNWCNLHALRNGSGAKQKRQQRPKELLHEFSALFTEELGEISKEPVTLVLKEKQFSQARLITFAPRLKMEEKIFTMAIMGWAAFHQFHHLQVLWFHKSSSMGQRGCAQTIKSP